MGNVDAAFSYDLDIKLMKVNNPGLIRMIRDFTCIKPYNSFPFLCSRNTHAALPKKILSFLGSTHKNDEPKRLLHVFKAFGIEFVSTENNDYKNIVVFFRKAESSGWNTDFRKWIAYSTRIRQ